MPNHVAPSTADAPQRIYNALSGSGSTLWPGDAATFLRAQIDAAANQRRQLPLQYTDLAGWISHDAQSAADAYHRYRVAREYGAPRRHFATLAQARQFLRDAAPARLADGASLYGVIERWDDTDFQPMIASYLEQLGQGVPDRNRPLLYRDLLAAAASSGTGGTPGNGALAHGALAPERYRGGALELALAENGDDFLPELIGFNVARQQPSAELLVARHELAELGLDAESFAAAGAAAGSGPSALLSLRGIMARVGDPAAFYRRVADGFRLHGLAGALPLPAAADAAEPLPAHDGPSRPAPASEQHAARGAAQDIGQAARDAEGRSTGQDASRQASPQDTMAPDAGAQERPRAERPVIRHHFPADEHAWETIGCELRLLEARLAASDSKEEAMATLARLLSPALHHTPAGLMATRIYTQLFNL